MTLLLGNNLGYLRGLTSESIDMVLTSPPYDKLRTYENTLEWNFEVFKDTAKELSRVLKPGGVIVWVVNDATYKGSETGSSFKQALFFKEDCGLNLHDTMIYMKDSNAFPDKNRYYPVFEYMFVLSKGPPKTFNQIKDRPNKFAGRKKHSCAEYNRRGSRVTKRIQTSYMIPEMGARHNVWLIPTGFGKTTKLRLDHPAMFPLQLAKDHITSWTNPGDVVLDPFMGSGTTGVASAILDRKFIGIEHVERYFHMAFDRINTYKMELE